MTTPSFVTFELLLPAPLLHAQLGGIVGGEFSLTNVSGSYTIGGEAGLFSYETDFGTHYLLGRAFYLEQRDITDPASRQSFELDSVGFGFG